MFVNYQYLVDQGIVSNRVTLARSIEQLDFPKPLELGKNRIAWDLDEVRAWLASRPRRAPKVWTPSHAAADKRSRSPKQRRPQPHKGLDKPAASSAPRQERPR